MAHYHLGDILKQLGQHRDAEAALREAIRLMPNHAESHGTRGCLLGDLGRYREAEKAAREAIRLKPGLVYAHVNLTFDLSRQERWVEAEAACREAIRLDPDNSTAHNNRSAALLNLGQFVEAETEARKAIRLKPDYVNAHYTLGQILRCQDRLTDALQSLRRSHELAAKTPGSALPTAEEVRRCERMIDLDRRLPAVLSGEAKPASTTERLEFALLCQLYKHRPLDALLFFTEAFADDPKLADKEPKHYRYNAACCAIVAAAGRGPDGHQLPDKVRTMWRRQGMAWLRADLDFYARQLAFGGDTVKAKVRQQMFHWKQDYDFPSIRDPDSLKALPEDKQQQWRALWADVDALLAKTEAVK